MSAPAAASSLTPGRAGTLARSWLYALVVLCFLLVKAGNLALLAPVLSILSLLAILVSLPVSGWLTRSLSTFFLASGAWMLSAKGIGWSGQIGAFGDMAYLLALFAVIPVLSAPIRLGGYGHAIQTVLRGRISTVFGLNCLATTLAFICGSFMSLAAVPVMIASMERVVGDYPVANKERFMAVAATYGYVMPILWTPVSGIVGVVLYSLDLSWLSLFPILFALSVAGLCANWGIFYLLELRGKARAAPAAPAPAAPGHAAPTSCLLQMLAAVVLLIVSVVLLEEWLRIGLITVVTLVVVPFTLAWSAMIGRARPFLADAGQQLLTRLPRMADQFAIFLSVGFFARAMHLSGVDHSVNLMLLQLNDAVGTQAFLILMPVMALAASYLGVHLLPLIALLGESLKPELLGISPAQLAIALIGSSVMTYMQGPFSGTLGLVQSITHVSTFRLSLWNAPYAAAYFVLLVATILLI